MTRDYIIPALVAVTVFLVAVFIGAFVARAHTAPTGWNYPINCCSGRDCTEAPAQAIVEDDGGITLVVDPSWHDMVTEPTVFRIGYNDTRIKEAKDGYWHVCVGPAIGDGKPRLLCVFPPIRGF